MSELEVLLHTGLYEAVQERFKGWSCEINTHSCGDCVNVHLMLKSDKLLVSVGKYRVGMNEDGFYKLLIEGLK